MADDPMVREIGRLTDAAGRVLIVGVDYDTVTIGGEEMTWRLTATQVEELAQLIVSATWEAAAHFGNVQGQRDAGAAAGAP